MVKAKTSSLVLHSALSKEGANREQLSNIHFKINAFKMEFSSLLFLFNPSVLYCHFSLA